MKVEVHQQSWKGRKSQAPGLTEAPRHGRHRNEGGILSSLMPPGHECLSENGRRWESSQDHTAGMIIGYPESKQENKVQKGASRRKLWSLVITWTHGNS